MFEIVLITVALIALAIRYAFSGVDNAALYRAQNERDLTGLPSVHIAELTQQTASAVVFAALTMLYEPNPLKLLLLWAAAFGAFNLGGYFFNDFIWQGKEETQYWDIKVFGRVFLIRKVFYNRRGLQVLFGLALSSLSLAIYFLL